MLSEEDLDHCEIANQLQSSEEDEPEMPNQLTKKRKVTGRVSDASKMVRLMSHATGPDCNCKKFKCFEVTTNEERQALIKEFNLLKTFDIQNAHLAGLISVLPIANRRPRIGTGLTSNECSYCYKVRVVRDGGSVELPVCHKGFMSIHGITNRRTQTLKKSLAMRGMAPVDGRGKHTNRPHKLSQDKIDTICEHIKSFKARNAHYSLCDTKKKYLSEELNIKKMFELYLTQYPQGQVSYEIYRQIFNTKFNLSFGYPRTDTCSTCDEYLSKCKKIELDKASVQNEDALLQLENLRNNLEKQNFEHKKLAETFYTKKRRTRKACRSTQDTMCIAMDYQKNLPLPNITTNDTYYKRQLKFYSFNIHELPTKRSYFYTYDETVSGKGSDEVISILYNYLTTKMPHSVMNLIIFCDSCSGQNKNFFVFKFLHHVVHYLRLLDSFTMIFPVRGHTYLECDRNMALINVKSPCEVPEQWREVFRNARKNPEPFIVIDSTKQFFHAWNEYLRPLFISKCPFPTRPVREIQVTIEQPGQLLYRPLFEGRWSKSTVIQQSVSNECPQQLHLHQLPISIPKFNDLQYLKRFCGPEGKEFIDQLKTSADEPSDSEDSLAGVGDE